MLHKNIVIFLFEMSGKWYIIMLMNRFLIVFFLFVVACIPQDGGNGVIAYETFIAKVDKIVVEKEVNISEPVRIGINGSFDDDCSELARIAAERTDSPNNIELTVYGKRRLNARCENKKVIYFGSITITGLQEGRYRIRINGDDNLVEYFSVIKGNTQDVSNIMDIDYSCVEEIAPVSVADITTDGFNSAKNQKIPYGTPISLIVRGNILNECRSFKGFRFSKIGYSLFVDVLAEHCENNCIDENRDYNETYIITGLSKGKYTLYVNNSIEIPFEVTD